MRAPKNTVRYFKTLLGNLLKGSHAVSGREVSVYKLLAGKIFHSFSHLQPETHQVLHCGVLWE